jgi:hypothetical protein
MVFKSNAMEQPKEWIVFVWRCQKVRVKEKLANLRSQNPSSRNSEFYLDSWTIVGEVVLLTEQTGVKN